jgi:hypothetical protein
VTADCEGNAVHHKDYRALVTVTAVALLLAAGKPSASAQTVAEVASYQGPNRTQRLIAGAKMLGEAQAILAKRDLVPTNPAVMPLPAFLALTFMDPAQMLDPGEKWTTLWEKSITKLQ